MRPDLTDAECANGLFRDEMTCKDKYIHRAMHMKIEHTHEYKILHRLRRLQRINGQF